MARSIATNTSVDLDTLLDFVRPRHRMLLATMRADGRPQMSPVTAVVEPQSLGIVKHLGDAIPAGNRLELFLGAAIGAITFSGSVIAFGKLSGKYKFRLFQGAPVQFGGQHKLNLALGLATLALGITFMLTGNLNAFALMLALAFVLGVLIIIPTCGLTLSEAASSITRSTSDSFSITIKTL